MNENCEVKYIRLTTEKNNSLNQYLLKYDCSLIPLDADKNNAMKAFCEKQLKNGEIIISIEILATK